MTNNTFNIEGDRYVALSNMKRHVSASRLGMNQVSYNHNAFVLLDWIRYKIINVKKISSRDKFQQLYSVKTSTGGGDKNRFEIFYLTRSALSPAASILVHNGVEFIPRDKIFVGSFYSEYVETPQETSTTFT